MHIDAQKIALALLAAVFVGTVAWSFGRRFGPKVGRATGITCGAAVFVLWLVV
jgi:hypothetical protein